MERTRDAEEPQGDAVNGIWHLAVGPAEDAPKVFVSHVQNDACGKKGDFGVRGPVTQEQLLEASLCLCLDFCEMWWEFLPSQGYSERK